LPALPGVFATAGHCGRFQPVAAFDERLQLRRLHGRLYRAGGCFEISVRRRCLPFERKRKRKSQHQPDSILHPGGAGGRSRKLQSHGLPDTRFYSYLLSRFLYSPGGVSINYKALVEGLLKSDFPRLVRESFGENEEGEGAWFKLYFKKKPVYEETGRSIKTMRKKGYKELLFTMID